MPIYRRYLSYIKFPLPGADFMTAFTVLAILVQFWLGSMVDESGFVTAELEHNYLVLGLSWIGISQWHLWQIVTYALAHGGWFHLVANLLMLWVVGGRVIDILGQKKFVLIVMVGVFVGGLLHLVIDYVVMGRGYPGTQLVGISGGCLALLLTLTTLSPASRVWPFRVSRKNLPAGARAAALAYRRLWEARPRGHVTIVHERAHIGTRGNEVADALAKRGTACDGDDTACEREPTPKPSQPERAGSAADSARPPGDPG